MNDRLDRAPASLGSFPSSDSVRIERELPAPIDRVWSYLTDPALLKSWLAGGSVNLHVGGIIDLDFDLIDCPGREEVHGTLQGIITVCNPPTLLAYTWGESGYRAAGNPDSLVTFELTAIDEVQTLLSITHTGVAKADRSLMGAGWHVHVDVLEDRLNARTPGHFMNAWNLIEPKYRELE
jgi:uncharacterized protein YndB with AHSA1/START domain